MEGYLLQFLHGLWLTILTALASCLLGTAAGLLCAAAIMSKNTAFKLAAETYTTVVRGVPELLIILLIYFGGTAAMSAIIGRYAEIGALSAGIAALSFIFGAYSAEIFRGALASIPVGQTEAAKSLGLARWHLWLLILLPQMARYALPAYCNLCISLIKDTALISVVGLTDIMRVAFVGSGAMRAPLSFYLAAAGLYLALTSVTLFAFRIIERRTLRFNQDIGTSR